MKKTPFTLLCGFLGSGKTTLLAHVLEQPSFSNAVDIINEFGEVSIDHLIVAERRPLEPDRVYRPGARYGRSRREIRGTVRLMIEARRIAARKSVPC